MARRVARGEIWMLRLPPPNKRRPVLVITRGALLEVLHTATVAAVTSQRRGSPTEVNVGVDEGLKADSAVNLANLFTVRQADLHQYVGSLPPPKLAAVCRALAIAHGCD
jgi:mRNA-degrading endonuclease toxin of MazEF toxin-antitoxin module